MWNVYRALIIDWGDAYQAATLVLELALEGAAVCLDLGKSSSFHAICQASKRAKGKWKNTGIWSHVKLAVWLSSVLEKRKKNPTWYGITEGKALVSRQCIRLCQNYQRFAFCGGFNSYLLFIKPVLSEWKNKVHTWQILF